MTVRDNQTMASGLDGKPYPDAVWQRFISPKYAGLPESDNLQVVEAETPAADAVLQLGWVSQDDKITQVGFLALGSPEVIAVAEYLSEYFFNQLLMDIELADVMNEIQAFKLPPEKRYCALLAEDIVTQIVSADGPMSSKFQAGECELGAQ